MDVLSINRATATSNRLKPLDRLDLLGKFSILIDIYFNDSTAVVNTYYGATVFSRWIERDQWVILKFVVQLQTLTVRFDNNYLMF